MKKKRDNFTDSYIDYYPLVFNAVYTKVGNLDDVKDICQEIFIIFYEKFDEIRNLRKWLLGTIRNVVYEYYRKTKKSTVDIDAIFNDVSLTYVNGFRDTRIIIADAIENIECDEQDRIILDLIANYNFTYAYVAETLGFSRRQIEYRYNQLVTRIQDYLGKKGIKNIEDLL